MGTLCAIAIDGPAATGKNTVGMRVARALDWPFVDSGAMYRAVTLAALEGGIPLDDHERLAAIARRCTIEVEPPGNPRGHDRILLDGDDVTDRLHSAEVDAAVSLVAQSPPVRETLVERQRAMAMQQPVVMVGRDIGTNVIPDATLKIYLDATPEVRALRRFSENRIKGVTMTLDRTLDEIRRRDELDAGRSLHPLRPAEDAVIIDTSSLEIDDIVDRIVAHAGKQE